VQRPEQRRRTQRTCPLLPSGCQAFSGRVRQQRAGGHFVVVAPGVTKRARSPRRYRFRRQARRPG